MRASPPQPPVPGGTPRAPGALAPASRRAAVDQPGGAPDQPAPLGEADVFGLAPSALLEAGRDYALLGRVHQPRSRGALLAAEVEGSSEVHAVRAEVVRADGSGGPAITPSCSCPAHRPFCRHVLALLFLWVWQPESFLPVGAWEQAMAALPAAESADALARVAMGESDPISALRQGAGVAWEGAPPGRCLEAWAAFRLAALARAAWPDAALQLAGRIAGTPGAPVSPDPLGVQARQLAWWLSLVALDLPAPALLPWLRRLFALLEAHRPGGGPLPTEVAVWLARLAVALPVERWAEVRWLTRFAAATDAVAGVFEAELQRQIWEAEVTWRVAGGAAVAEPHAGLRRVRLVWEAYEEDARVGSGAEDG